MEQLFNKIIQILKKKKSLVILAVGLFIISIFFYYGANKVTAQILPVTVNVNHLAFGTVFPGEDLRRDLTVSFVQEYEEDGIIYRLIQERKSLPTDHPEYPNGGDPDMPGYYRDLCPYLTKVSIEEEGDTEDMASVGLGDLSDTWIIYFKVPAIVGNVAQAHIGGVVTSDGEYGCDISIDVIEPPAE